MLTKRKALKLTYEIWKQAPVSEVDKVNDIGHKIFYSNCPACEYALRKVNNPLAFWRDKGDKCEYCPSKKLSNPPCFMPGSLYSEWKLASSSSEKKQAARKLAAEVYKELTLGRGIL